MKKKLRSSYHKTIESHHRHISYVSLTSYDLISLYDGNYNGSFCFKVLVMLDTEGISQTTNYAVIQKFSDIA
jgi:hypothetical protein